jgi:uncharacterized protein CbrC (UPF0167 family)
MADSVLPVFPYHRDPIASGSIVASTEVCECCGLARGWRYEGNIYTVQKVEHLCPWCIADGSAARKFDAWFFDGDFYDDKRKRVKVADHYREAVFRRTVGFATFNPVSWWVHCGEPASYIDRSGHYAMLFECRRCRQRQEMPDYD